MNEELSALHKTDTWDLVLLPPGKSTVSSRWVYKIKTKSDGSLSFSFPFSFVFSFSISLNIFVFDLCIQKYVKLMLDTLDCISNNSNLRKTFSMHGDISKTKRGRLGKGSSDVWTKFTKYGDRTRCKCNYCGKDYMFVKFLHVFYDITLKFSSSLSVTSNLFFHELCSIETELTSFAKSNDSVLSEMSSSMKSKFDKYWGKIEDVNKLLIIALVLDPRYKLEYVKFCFDDMFDDKKTKELTCDIRELLIQLYECYNGVENILSSDQTSSSVSFDVEKTSTRNPEEPKD
ncbi:hypothetical protein ACOSP7_030571 [Xanthoceras sorbifolium]